MQNDSDTESEHEYDTRCKDGVINGLRFSCSNLSTGEKNASCNALVRDQDALSAVEQIKSVDLSTICQVRIHRNTKTMVIHCFIGYRHPRSRTQSI
jgi:hypothetical protein